MLGQSLPAGHGPNAEVVVELGVVPARIEPCKGAGRGGAADVVGEDGDVGAVSRQVPGQGGADDAGPHHDHVWCFFDLGAHLLDL